MMMTEGLISIVIPVYNTAQWLRRCLDSVCAQTYSKLEIICVDDGSTDESMEILNEYAEKDTRIRLMKRANGGVSAARNDATAVSCGEWICYVDSDDYVAPGTLEEVLRMAAPEVDIISFGVENVWDTGVCPSSGVERYYTLHRENQVVPASPAIAGELSHAVWGKLWRGSLIREYGVHSPLGLRYEDESFVYFALHHARYVAFCAAVGYYYLQRSTSFIHTRMSAAETMDMTLKVMRYTMDNVKVDRHAPSECPWCQDMLSRLYEARIHAAPEYERPQLTGMTAALACEMGFLPRLSSDYRFRCMVPVRGWKRLFLSRYLNAEVYRFLGVPVWLVEYENGEPARRSCLLVSSVLRKLGFGKSMP